MILLKNRFTDRNKNFLFYLLLFAACFIPVNSPAGINTGLRGFYSFDGNAVDRSGKGNNGTAHGGVQYKSGLLGKAACFDGRNDYISILRPIERDFTISLWMKTSYKSRKGKQCYQGDGIVWSDKSGVADDFILAALNNRLCMFTGNPDRSVKSSSRINTGSWIHLAATRKKNSGRVKIYVNGKKEGSMKAGKKVLNDNSRIRIGGNTLDKRYFHGCIDELRLYDRVLSQNEIGALASIQTKWPKKTRSKEKSTVPAQASSQIAQWKMQLADSVWKTMYSDPSKYVKLHMSSNIGLSYDDPNSFYTANGAKWRVHDGQLIIVWRSGSLERYNLPAKSTNRLIGTWKDRHSSKKVGLKLIRSGSGASRISITQVPSKSVKKTVRTKKTSTGKTKKSNPALETCLKELAALSAKPWRQSRVDVKECRKQIKTVKTKREYEKRENKTKEILAKLRHEKDHRKRLALIMRIELKNKREKELKDEKQRYEREQKLLDICLEKLLELDYLPSKGAMKYLPDCRKDIQKAQKAAQKKRKKENRQIQRDFQRSQEIVEQMGGIDSLRFRRELAETIPDDGIRKDQLAKLDKEKRDLSACLRQLRSLGKKPSKKAESTLSRCMTEFTRLKRRMAQKSAKSDKPVRLPILPMTYTANYDEDGNTQPADRPGKSGAFLFLHSISINPGHPTTEIKIIWDINESDLRRIERTAEIKSGFLVISGHASKDKARLSDAVANWDEGSAKFSIPTDQLAKIDLLWLRFSLTIGKETWEDTWKKVNIVKAGSQIPSN